MIEWLSGVAAVVVAIATVVLVGVTWHYARTTRKALGAAERSSKAAEAMVEEMRAGRQATVLPKIAADLVVRGVDLAVVRVTNVGVGPALDMCLSVAFEPVGGDGADTRTWRALLLAPGESRALLPPTQDHPSTEGSSMRVEDLAQNFARVVVTGTMKDALGSTHQIEEVIEDIAGWWRSVRGAKQLVPFDAGDQIVRKLGKVSDRLDEIRGELQPLSGGAVRSMSARPPLQRIAQALERISPPPATEDVPEQPPSAELSDDAAAE